jgi:pyruvate dehydrogenase E2 component (dihydrolipoamide acetyltransferase)
MSTDILMPALSPTMEEGTLAKWHIKQGDTVSSGDVIAEIETDKATMEVEAVDEGVVSEILVPEGTEGVKVNTPIARLNGAAGAERRLRRSRSPQPKPRRLPQRATRPRPAIRRSSRPRPPSRSRKARGRRPSPRPSRWRTPTSRPGPI